MRRALTWILNRAGKSMIFRSIEGYLGKTCEDFRNLIPASALIRSHSEIFLAIACPATPCPRDAPARLGFQDKEGYGGHARSRQHEHGLPSSVAREVGQKRHAQRAVLESVIRSKPSGGHEERRGNAPESGMGPDRAMEDQKSEDREGKEGQADEGTDRGQDETPAPSDERCSKATRCDEAQDVADRKGDQPGDRSYERLLGRYFISRLPHVAFVLHRQGGEPSRAPARTHRTRPRNPLARHRIPSGSRGGHRAGR